MAGEESAGGQVDTCTGTGVRGDKKGVMVCMSDVTMGVSKVSFL